MSVTLGELIKCHKSCQQKVKQFWGSSLKRKPKIEIGDETKEYPETGRIIICIDDIDRYARKIREITKKTKEEARNYLLIHASMHLYACQENEHMYGCSLFKMPRQPIEHQATIEAIVCVGTTKIADNKEKGDAMAEAYFNLWEDQLKQRGEDPSPAIMSRGSYYTLKKMEKTKFIQYVREYKSN